MSSLKAIARHRHIVDVLQAHGRASVAALCADLAVSSVTIRADLFYLEKAQVLRRIRGGAIAVHPSRYERPLDLNASLRRAEKEAIADLAAGMIRDGETIIIDTGSTMVALAKAMPRHLTDVAVLTNALDVAIELSLHPGMTVILTGGTVRPRVNSLVSPFGTLLLNEINADVAFVSCTGVESEKGFTNSNWQEAEIKKAMIKAASRIIVLADHSKLKHVATARIAALDEADLLITDSGASADTIRELRAGGLQVAVA
jgi:DeoR family transcriptional regulator of aga operon